MLTLEPWLSYPLAVRNSKVPISLLIGTRGMPRPCASLWLAS